MIPHIRNTFLRRTAVIVTVAFILVIFGPIWIVEAVGRKVREEFGPDVNRAWNGDDHGR